MKRLTSTLLLVTLAHAAAAGCGGESLRHGDSDDGGETGGTSANGGTSGAAGASGHGGTSGAASGSSGTSGIGGNGANAGTAGSGGGTDAAACSLPTDCTLISSSCCGCESPTLANRVAVNVNRTGDVFQAMRCHLVDCVACEPIAPNPWLGATCRDGQCVAFDARQSELTACMSNDDCHLRAGLGCCEACNATLDTFVAVSSLVDPRPLLCGNTGSVGCDACVPTPPDTLFTYCSGDGHCSTVIAER